MFLSLQNTYNSFCNIYVINISLNLRTVLNCQKRKSFASIVILFSANHVFLASKYVIILITMLTLEIVLKFYRQHKIVKIVKYQQAL